MYAIVEIAGLQYKVEKDQQLYVNRLQGEEGDNITFDRVLLTDNGTVQVGAPVIKGTAVTAKIVEHLKGNKVIVFKKKRRKGYRKKNGHRQPLTKIEIVGIGAGQGNSSQKAEKEPVTKKKTDKKDDLTLIEGIGPKSAEALNAAGIVTFTDLAGKSVEDIQKILSEHSRLAHLDPQTWPKQAQLAAEGKFDELKEWQDLLDGGVPPAEEE